MGVSEGAHLCDSRCINSVSAGTGQWGQCQHRHHCISIQSQNDTLVTVEPRRGVEWGVEVGIKNHLARNEHQINISWCHKQPCYVGNIR